jgi:hypothetical protein
MKKLIILGMSTAFAMNASAQSLEDRVEALEYAGYESYTKVGGRLEYRFDSTRSEWGKDQTYLNTGAGILQSNNKGRVTGSGYQTVLLNLNIESKPSDKLTFYGKLSMAKYTNHLSDKSGAKSEDTSFNDLSRGTTASSSDIFVERAFINYNVTKNLTFTLGRLPTSQGAPYHFSEGSTRKGNYPILAFGGHWDGVAATYNLGSGQSFKLVYTPVSSFNPAKGASEPIQDSDGNAVDSNSNAYTAIYELERANTLGARNFYFLASYYSLKDMPTLPNDGAASATNIPSNLYLSLDRISLYGEWNGIADSKFDAAFHAVQSSTKTKGQFDTTALGLGKLGWMSNSDSDTLTDTAYGVLFRYSLTATSKIGYEYFTAGKNVFLYDPTNQNGASIYTTIGGSAQHVFYQQDFDGGLKVVLGHIMKQSDYSRKVFGLFGDAEKADITSSNSYARFIASF